MGHNNSEEITDRWQNVCLTILRDARTALYLDMRYMDLPLSSLELMINTELNGIGTDGQVLAAHPKVLSDLFLKDHKLVNRVFLHQVLHCMLYHPFKTAKHDTRLWRLSCDIACESVIDGLRGRSVRMAQSHLRRECYENLHRFRKVLTAEGVYYTLSDMRRQGNVSEALLLRLEKEFETDDHSLWPSGDDENRRSSMEQQRNRWQDISEKTQTRMDTVSKEEASGDSSLEENLSAENRERYCYRDFLRRFAVLREEMKADPDTFDYVFYTFGLQRYGNMPLIEPQEFREVKKIEEFVIVLDVSMSTSGELVRTFLDQTYEILSERETYLHKVNIRILQCDESVRSDRKITSAAEMEAYLKDFTLYGGGGTDFRPAFDYVRNLKEEGQFKDLRGMIYFTDGRGVWPSARPPWETAFVFMEEDYTDRGIPPWAIRLVIGREDLEDENAEREKPLLPRTDYYFK